MNCLKAFRVSSDFLTGIAWNWLPFLAWDCLDLAPLLAWNCLELAPLLAWNCLELAPLLAWDCLELAPSAGTAWNWLSRLGLPWNWLSRLGLPWNWLPYWPGTAWRTLILWTSPTCCGVETQS